MSKNVSQKMSVKKNSRAVYVNAEKEALENINLPTLDIQEKFEEEFDYIHLFVKTQAEFIDYFPKLKSHLKLNGMLWISWPKSRRLDTDLKIKSVI